MYGDASNPATTKKTERTKLNTTTTKKTKQRKQLGQYGSGEDLSDMPSDIIYSICKQFIDEDDYNAVENLIKTNKRIESICEPVYKAHLAKERENPTQITREGHLLWAVPYEGSRPCGKNKEFVTALLHREGGLPAVIRNDGTREWWVDGTLYRPRGKPVIVYADGTKCYYLGPPQIKPLPLSDDESWTNIDATKPDGTKETYVIYVSGVICGKQLYSADRFLDSYMDRPAVIRPDGTREWWLNGKKHRTDGPAVIYPDGSEEWWLNGKKHRNGGPAVIYHDGSEEWWLNGKKIMTRRVNPGGITNFIVEDTDS